jgi:hypothetical protein
MKRALGTDVVEAIAKAKNDFRQGRLRPHRGNEILNPQVGIRGGRLYEAYVGLDREGNAGSRRLVLFEQSGRIEEMYFSEDHYRPGSWCQILDF